MAGKRRRSLKNALKDHHDALKDLQDEINMAEPDEIAAAAQRERDAHAALVQARQADASRKTRSKASRSDGTPPAR